MVGVEPVGLGKDHVKPDDRRLLRRDLFGQAGEVIAGPRPPAHGGQRFRVDQHDRHLVRADGARVPALVEVEQRLPGHPADRQAEQDGD